MPPPPDDDRAVDDASQALSELSDNVNDFLRMQAKVGIPSLVERLPRRARGRAVVVHTPATRARRRRVDDNCASSRAAGQPLDQGWDAYLGLHPQEIVHIIR